jgi:hypothetical protein
VLRKPLVWTLAAASAAVLLWAGRWFFTAPAPEPLATVPGRPAVVSGAATPAAAATATPAAAPGTHPPGVTAEQWAALEAELRTRPDGAAERSRLIAYFTWADAVQRWRAAPQDATLAATVDAGLGQRLQQREVSAAEARLLKAALLATLEPDETRRAAALQAYDSSLPTPAGPSAREQAFQRQQAALVAAWQARPAAERDPAALNRQLDTLRRTHFASPPASSSVPGR